MVFGFGLGKRTQDELDKDYYKRRAIYLEAREKQREDNAHEQGIRDANAYANRKPFYKKVTGAAKFLVTDLSAGASKMNPEVFFSWGNQKTTRKRKRRKK